MLLPETERLLKNLANYKVFEDFVLVGGSALSIYLKHRYSGDLDFFSFREEMPRKKLSNWLYRLRQSGYMCAQILSEEYQMDFAINEVKVSFCAMGWTFLKYEKRPFLGRISIALLETLVALKAYTLSFRNALRDYYDLYVLLKEQFSLKEIISITTKRFPDFNPKLFLSQLSYLKDIEQDTLPGFLKPKYQITKKDIEKFFESKISKFLYEFSH